MAILSPKVLIAAAALVILFIVFSLAQEMNRRLQIQQEVARLEQEVHDLEKTVVEMENLNQYFQTDAFAELMAREKLNYRAEGEKVVLIPEVYSGNEVASGTELGEERAVSIPRRWWDAFFVTPLLEAVDST